MRKISEERNESVEDMMGVNTFDGNVWKSWKREKSIQNVVMDEQ